MVLNTILGGITSELDRHPEVLMEAIQTVCRRWNIPAAYEMAKEFSHGKSGAITLDAIKKEFISKIPGLPEAERDRLLALTHATYLGLIIYRGVPQATPLTFGAGNG